MAALGLASLPTMQQPSFLQAAQAGQQQQQQQQQQHAQLLQQPIAPPTPTPLDATAITIKLATLAGERFKESFYNVFDEHRTDLHRFFLPQSVLVWEGTAVQGSDQCRQLFEMLPPSKHTIATFDVQPVTGGEMRGSVNCLLVNVTGNVQWGRSGSSPSGFYHTFVLERGSSSSGKPVHHVVSSSMRTRLFDDVTQSTHNTKKKRSLR